MCQSYSPNIQFVRQADSHVHLLILCQEKNPCLRTSSIIGNSFDDLVSLELIFNSEDVSFYLKNKNKEKETIKIENNKLKIENEYDINKINGSYLSYFYECLSKN